MRSQFGRWSLPVVGLGVGVGLGWAVGRIGPVVAMVVVVAGLLMAIGRTLPADQSSREFSANQTPREARRADREARRAERAQARRLEEAARPTLSGLGDRVAQILRLAEEQANNHRSEAKRESEQILAAAQREAEEIISNARALAGEADQPSHLENDQR